MKRLYINPQLSSHRFATESIVTESQNANPDGITAVENVQNSLGDTYNENNTYVVNWSDMVTF